MGGFGGQQSEQGHPDSLSPGHFPRRYHGSQVTQALQHVLGLSQGLQDESEAENDLKGGDPWDRPRAFPKGGVQRASDRDARATSAGSP